MNIPPINIASILPAVVLSIAGVIIMVAEPFTSPAKKSMLGWLGLGGVIAAMLALVPMSNNRGQWYSNLWIVDDYNIFFHVVFLLIAGITVLTSLDFLARERMNHPEFYALLLFATTGMLMMSGSNELMMVFIGLEILSIATYVLAGFKRTDLRSNEAALKYFLLGSFSSAFFLYGVALIFGATGSTNLIGIAEALRSSTVQITLVYLGAALILIALCFKIAVAPFHIWTPDVYEGAPTPVTGFMSVGPKAAGFAVFLRVFMTAFPSIQDRWISVIWMVAALTMILGNVIAVSQLNIKRMLAYSSIAHAGYIAVAFASGSQRGISAALFYVLAYSLTNLGAFAIITVLSRSEDKLVNISDYAGLAAKRPGLAALLTLFLLSLAGIPGTAGFAGKFFIFRSSVESGLLSLTVIGVVTSVISFYYYLYIVVQMYMREPGEEFANLRLPVSLKLALLITAAGTLYLGILPTRVLEWSTTAALHARCDEAMRKAIGIDFGTTNSSIAIARGDRTTETVRFKTGTGTTDTYRSVLYFEPGIPGVSGPIAIEQYLADDEKGRLIQSLKSFLASRLFTSTSVFGRIFSLEDLITIMLRDLRVQAEQQVGEFSGPIVVGRPVRYSNADTEEDNQFALNRLQRSLEKAGIGPVVFEYEPVAAAYFYESTLDHDELIMIGDFGGGTSDFSLLHVGPTALREGTHRILGTEGVALAGDSFDSRIVHNLVSPKLGRGSEYRSVDKILPMPEWIYSDLSRWHYLSFLKSNDTIQMLRSIQIHSLEPEKIAALIHIVQNDLGFTLHQAVQEMKTELSSEPVGSFVFEDHVLHMRGRVRRATFEGWIEQDLQKIRGCVDRLLAATGIASAEVDRVFLTGGSSLVPAVRRIFEERFGSEKISGGSEFTSVAKGLALRGAD